jgi:hypothetical protein
MDFPPIEWLNAIKEIDINLATKEVLEEFLPYVCGDTND